MAGPTPLPESFVSCIDHTFVIGATPNTAALKILDGGFTDAMGVDEMTNNLSGGAYEDQRTYKTLDGQFTVAFDPTTDGVAPVIVAGNIFPLVIDNADQNGVYLSGNFRFNGIQPTVLDAKGAVKYQFTIKNQGAYTRVRPTGS